MYPNLNFRGEKGNCGEVLLGEIMTKKFLELFNESNPSIQEVQHIPNGVK